MALMNPGLDLTFARVRDLDVTDPGATSEVRVMLETVVSFCLNGLGCAVLETAARSAGLGVLSSGLTAGALARSAGWFHFNVNRGLLESMRLYRNTNWSTTWLASKPRGPLILVAARTLTFALSKLVLAKAAKGTLGKTTQVVFRGLPGSLAASFGIAISLVVAWFMPRCEICSQHMTLSKTLAFLVAKLLDHAISKRKARISASFTKSRASGVLERGRRYEYAPIRDPRAIRLLKLSPAGGDLARASLQIYPLDEIPDFYAVSYMWGSSDRVSNLDISEDEGELGGHIPITKSCQNVLTSLAPGGKEPRYLWIDAVCINQEDSTEKETQIPLMGDIYRGASHVLAFPDGDTTLPMGDFIRRLSYELFREKDTRPKSAAPRVTQWAKTIPSPRGGVLSGLLNWAALSYLRDGWNIPLQSGWLDRKSWIALRGILQNQYWRRAWIVQEIVLARSLILVYGNNTFTWDHLSLISQLLTSNPMIPAILSREANGKPIWDLHHTLPRYTPMINQLKGLEHESRRLPVSELLNLVSRLEIHATQARDRIYSLLALSSDANAVAHKPTYNSQTPSWAISARATVHSLRHGHIHLLLLSGLAYDYPEPGGSEPSWTPNLSRWREPREGNRRAVQARLVSCPFELGVSSDDKQLSLRGDVVGSVVAISAADPMVAAADIGSAEANWDRDMSELFVRVHDAAREVAVKQGCSDQDFYRAMVMYDSTADAHTPTQVEAAVKSFVARVRNFADGRFVDEGPAAGVADSVIDLGRSWWVHWSRYIFAITDTGLVGWVPVGTCVGDAVCLFWGCGVPFILRRKGDETFGLYGDGYFQGLEPATGDSTVMRWLKLV
ncbi:heterokaryon incompatibility protein-domain-containing protein [Lasiosphaeria hispida]|uniref:Heterokaryon incompatibility protein-domain-containing protein n=1 Tax=Lasiosphaeria hispida TaxID=260671 RepID=A0AAJ0HI60_9PEZI|nr:heterokaryon incompatibility protein-domain-containing protein [Lasiosphaeria hispida]